MTSGLIAELRKPIQTGTNIRGEAIFDTDPVRLRAADHIDSLEAALAEVREALKPFAMEAEAISKAHLDGHASELDMRPVAIGHLRRAARALDGGEG